MPVVNNEGTAPVAPPDIQHLPTLERLTAPITLKRSVTSSAGQVTPHRVVTLAFVVDYLYGKQQDDESVLTPVEKTKICYQIVNMIMFSDQSLPATIDSIKPLMTTGPTNTILISWARGLLKLKSKGIAGLMDLFGSVEKLIINEECHNLISRKSLVGLQMRRLFLQFDKMSFSEVSTLQLEIAEYISSAQQILSNIDSEKADVNDSSGVDVSSEMDTTTIQEGSYICKTDSSSSSFNTSSNIQALSSSSTNRGMSKKQADLFIARQAALIQISETHAMTPTQLQIEINNILKSNPALPEAYFLSYLNYRRMGEVSLSIDSLHSNSDADHVVDPTSKQTLEQMNQSFRYADLNLGSLHARFGHHDEARTAITEAVKIGQEAKDHTCLQHCLSWLTRECVESNAVSLYQRSISRCEELKLPYLASLGMISLAAKTEELGHKPEYILDLLTRSSVINCNFNLIALQGNCSLVRSKVWSTWGRPIMNQTLLQVLLRITFIKEGVPYQGEQTILGLCNMALTLENEGYRHQTQAILNILKSLYQCPTSQYCQLWKIAEQKILFSRHLAAGDWIKAESALAVLSALQPGRETWLWEAELSFRQGDMEAARNKLTQIINHFKQKERTFPYESKEIVVRSYILLSEIQVVSHHTGGALEYLMTAKHICEKNRLELLHCLVCLHIANNHLIMAASKKALKLVRQCLVFLLAHGCLRDRSRGLLLCAKCRIAASADLGEVERRSDLLEGASQVGLAKDGFMRLQDWDRVKDCLYLQARIYHSLGLTLERNMAAKQYKKFDELYPSSGPVLQLVLI